MRILIANYEYPPLGGGGAWAAAQIAKNLVELGHEVGVLTAGRGSTLLSEDVEDGVRVWRCACFRPHTDRAGFKEMASFIQRAHVHLPAVIKALQPQVAILFFLFPTGMIGPRLKLKFDIPYVIAFRGGDVPGLELNIRWIHRILSPLRYRILKHSAAVTANSKSLAASAQPYSHHPVSVIANGVDSQFFAPTKSGQPHPFRFICGGRLQAQKNLPSILNAFRKLNSDVELWILGDGPMKTSLELDVEAWGLGERVTFTGWLDRDELRQAYQQADCLINFSNYEGHSNVALEAMACGLPVIASKVTGNEELIIDQETGWLVQPSVDALVDRMSKTAANSAQTALIGTQAARWVQDHLSWTRTAESYADLLEALLTKGSGGSKFLAAYNE